MAQELVEGGRIYFPPEDPNYPDERTVMHPETNSDQVLMPDGNNLSDAIGGAIVVSGESPNKNCIWGKVTDSEIEA